MFTTLSLHFFGVIMNQNTLEIITMLEFASFVFLFVLFIVHVYGNFQCYLLLFAAWFLLSLNTTMHDMR